MNEEFAFHVDMEAERLVRDLGVDQAEARRRSLAVFGGLENHKAALRGDRGLAWLGGMSLDLKLGLRMMMRYPGLTIIGGSGMAVAVAVGAVTFGLIYAIIGGTLPLDDGDRIVSISNLEGGNDNRGRRTHLHDLAVWRKELRAVEALGAYRSVDRNLLTPGVRPEPVRIAEMTASGFRIARVPPLIGRYFNDADERPEAPPVVVIGHSIWQARFGGEPDVVGKTLQLGATRHTIVGVMPDGFAFPVNNRIWTPLRLDPSRFERGAAPELYVFGRLTPTATLDDARAQLETIGRRLTAAYPGSHERVRPWVVPYAKAFFERPDLTWALDLVQLAVSMLLVVIGTNVAVLVYARTVTRTAEIAVRTALGASRRRIVAQLFAEALVLTSIAAGVGLAAASLALRYVDGLIVEIAGEQRAFWIQFGVSTGMVVYVAGLAVVGAVIVGVLPALKATGRRVHASFQQLGLGGSSMRLGKTWTVLIVAQVAVAVALLPAVVHSAFLQRRPEGTRGPAIPTTGWLIARVHLDREDSGAGSAQDLDSVRAIRYATLTSELVRRIEREPGISGVVVASDPPGAEQRIRIEADTPVTPARDATVGASSAAPAVRQIAVDDRFFRAFGVPVLAGRAFQAADFSREPNVVIVNRSFVDRALGPGSALGRRVRRPATTDDARSGTPAGPWYEVIGVVPDFPSPGALSDPAPTLYQPLVKQSADHVTLAVHLERGAPTELSGRLRELAVAVDPMLRLDDVRGLDNMLSIATLADRVSYTAVAFVTASVVLLSAAGIYALISFTIARRSREIGIRTALGGGSGRVLMGVLSKAARQIGIGIAIGLAIAGLLVQTLEGGRGDPRGVWAVAGVGVFMGVIGLVAAFGPARRALQIQPTQALKAE